MAGTDVSQPTRPQLENAAEQGHEGTPAASPAEGTIDEGGSGRRIKSRIETEPQRRAGDRHQQAGGDAVPAGITDDHY
jgi:hypothetical protein